MNKARWILVNGLYLAAVWFGVYQGHEWVANVLKFMIWFGLTMALLIVLMGDKINKALRENPPAFSMNINAAYTFVFVLSLAGAGWFGYAGIALFSLLVINIRKHLPENN